MDAFQCEPNPTDIQPTNEPTHLIRWWEETRDKIPKNDRRRFNGGGDLLYGTSGKNGIEGSSLASLKRQLRWPLDQKRTSSNRKGP
jgi:hypothetical protein